MEKVKELIPSKILFSVISEQLAVKRQAAFTVTGMSMWPFLCHGRDQVIVEAVTSKELRRGDVILFQAAGERWLLHRITRKMQDCFETTGDGNLFRDGVFPDSCVMARVCKVVHNGKTIDCSSMEWKLLSTIWMMLFPVRKTIFNVWFRIRSFFR